MNRSLVVPAAEVVLVVFGIALAVLCWSRGVHTTELSATGDYPAYTASRYVPPWLFLATVLTAGAGLLVIDAAARLVRRGSRRTGPVQSHC